MEADDLVAWLLEQKPNVALQWLHDRSGGTHTLPEEFDWRLLAECAASNTFQRGAKGVSPDLSWAYIAVIAYNHIISEEKVSTRLAHNPEMKKFSYLSLEVALMTVQAQCILSFGQVDNDPVLDVRNVITCFFDHLPFAPKDVLKYLPRGKKDTVWWLGSAELTQVHRELVRIRKKLAILLLLRKNHMLPPNQDIECWLDVWDQTHF